MSTYNPLRVTQVNNEQGTHRLFSPETNVEPYPTFDIEINKEDKDGDIDHPEIQKDPKIDKEEDTEPSNSGAKE